MSDVAAEAAEAAEASLTEAASLAEARASLQPAAAGGEARGALRGVTGGTGHVIWRTGHWKILLANLSSTLISNAKGGSLRYIFDKLRNPKLLHVACLKRGGLKSSGRRLISLNGKIIAFFSQNILFKCFGKG